MRRLYQAEQSLRDDLPRLPYQFVNDLPGRLDLADQAHSLARQQSHRIDVATRLTIGRHAHEAQHRHRLAANYRLADGRLVQARFLTARLLAEPLLHKGGPQCPVRGVWPAVAEQNGPDRTPLVRLQQPLLVVRMGMRLGAGQKPGTQHRRLRAQRQDGNHAAGIGDAAGPHNRVRGDGIDDARDQGQRGDLPRDVAPRLDPLRDNDIDAGGCPPLGLRHGTDLVEDLHAGVMSTPHVRRWVAPEEREDGDALLQTDGNVVLDGEVEDQVDPERRVRLLANPAAFLTKQR